MTFWKTPLASHQKTAVKWPNYLEVDPFLGPSFRGARQLANSLVTPGGDSRFDDTTRFFQLDEDFKSAVEPFMLLPDRLSLNRDLSGLDQADIVKLEQEIRNRDLSGLDQADIDRLEQEIRSK